jgi:glutamate-1-semialdehyde aminotransferase
MSRLVFTDHPISSRREHDERGASAQVQRFFRMAMLVSKVYTAENGILFLSTSHDTDVVKVLIEAFQENLRRFAQHGAWSHA